MRNNRVSQPLTMAERARLVERHVEEAQFRRHMEDIQLRKLIELAPALRRIKGG